MKYIEGQDRNQLTLFPECVEDYISEDNPVRVIDAFVNSLDMKELGFRRFAPEDTGRPPYDPRDLLKLYIYGYFNKIRSSRRLMQECGRNIELFWLMRKLQPDFRTIADFRKDNAKAIRQSFLAFGKLCLQLGLYQRELLAVDGSKFRAVNSDKNVYTAEVLEKKLANIEQKLSRYLSELDEEDKTDAESAPDADTIRAAIAELQERKEKYIEYLTELKNSGQTQLLTTDSEARRMHSKDGFHSCYNIQTAVDAGSHLIVDYEVTNRNTDQGLLTEVTNKAKEQLEVDVIETTADKGYESREDILNCLFNGTVPNVALKYDKTERLYNIPYVEAEITEELRSSTKPEDIKTCISAGVLPKCFEGTAVEVELQEKGAISCFILNADGTVTCPMGNIMRKKQKKGENTIYQCRDACRQCPNRCVPGSRYKTVSFGPNTDCVPVKIYGGNPQGLQQIPPNAKISPYNHVLDRKSSPDKKVVIRIREDKEKLKQRMCLSEHPFGTVKWYHGAHYLLCKGKEKASAELGLSFLVYNLKRAINMIGMNKLMAALTG
jgi:transposase